jgi:methionyl-tRNA formyltransferase
LVGETVIKHAPKIFKEDCKIDWDNETKEIRNRIRGLSPFPTAWCNLVSRKTGEEIFTKLYYAKKVSLNKIEVPGTIKTDSKSYLNVACKNGWLQITDLQLAGKKRMKTEDFLRGFQQIGEYHFE